jgi:FtsP/CotA-like multicopper oxidase with cupredoxin domain
MERYIWHINGKAINEDRLININEGDVVRFTFENGTMMHHPMHLHGHFFRVLNKNGEFSPLKHTVDVSPMGSRTIEFYANEPGQWMLHCHNLYHMDSGMARVVKYNTYKPTPAQEHLDHQDHQDHHRHNPWYQTGSVLAASNIFEGKYKLSQT